MHVQKVLKTDRATIDIYNCNLFILIYKISLHLKFLVLQYMYFSVALHNGFIEIPIFNANSVDPAFCDV